MAVQVVNLSTVQGWGQPVVDKVAAHFAATQDDIATAATALGPSYAQVAWALAYNQKPINSQFIALPTSDAEVPIAMAMNSFLGI